ncbi:glycosyltransferase family 2 protein [Thiomonas bhubaneswarensis]|uniref:Glycosyltransferase involved in cell wall bisynthesis n=1 Tax=Thiomonas bhubaneswarensis TaxID=339866 RepID=A0A0K6HXL5_9BURK|nr:glycosyltransferase [Thiomonas bhubaneswarensis]CUA95605.1 Glycosyltransferase involved in cell wall bisynthesis [Thiomonas bhubaneswarensis]
MTASHSAPDPQALVSVLIPAYNAQATIAQTLDSLLAQTHRHLEIVVVDDGSTDATWEVLQPYADRVRLIRQANAGIGAARNVSVQAARGDYIALLDADDLCMPTRMAMQLRFLQTHPDILLCSADFGAFNADGPLAASYCGVYYARCSPARGGVRARYPHAERFALSADEQVLHGGQQAIDVYWGEVYKQLIQGNFIHPPTVMFRREALKRAGSFDPSIRIVCEWEWFVRVARAGPVAYLDLPLIDYRLSPSQISASPSTALDSLAVAKSLYQRDQDAARRPDRRALRHLGALSLSAADMLAEMQPEVAIGLLASSVFAYHTFKGQTLRTLFKIAMPSALLHLLRRVRS